MLITAALFAAATDWVPEGVPQTLLVAHEVDGSGRNVRTVFPSGAEATTSYHPNGLVAHQTATSGAQSVDFDWSYDRWGQPSEWAATDGTALGTIHRSGRDQVASLSWSFGSPLAVTDTVSYQWAGNGLLMRRVLPNNESVDYTYDSQAWRIESENTGPERHYTAAGAPTQANGWTYVFSQPMGRPSHRTHPVLAQQDFGYDSFGNLTSWSGGPVDRTFAYDGAQHLVESTSGANTAAYDYSVDNELMVEWRDSVRYQLSFEGWTQREGVVYEKLLPFLTARDGELLYVLKEPDGRSNWIRRLDGTLLTDDNSGVYGEEWGLTVGGGWPLDELHGGTRDSTDALMHFGARHMLVEDGRWLQPEPLLYMGVTNGDLTNPLGYGPVYARGNSNLYGDPAGAFPGTLAVAGGGALATAGSGAAPMAAAHPLGASASAGLVTGTMVGGAVHDYLVDNVPGMAQLSETTHALAAGAADAAAGLIFSADGADDGASDDASQGGETFHPDSDYTPGGREVSVHAGERMEDRGFTGEVVDGIVENNEGVMQDHGTVSHVDTEGNEVVVNGDDTKVVTTVGGNEDLTYRPPR